MTSCVAWLTQRERQGRHAESTFLDRSQLERVKHMGPSRRLRFPALRAPILALALDAVEDTNESDSGAPLSEQQLLPIQSSASRFRHEKAISSLTWWPQDTGAFLSASYDATVALWDTEIMEPSRVFRIKDRVYSVSVSPLATHTLIACGTQSHYLRLCDARIRSTAQILKGHKDAILAVEWSPRDEYILASGGLDGSVLLWDVIGQVNGTNEGDDGWEMACCARYGSPFPIDQDDPPSEEFQRAHDGIVNGLAFTPSGDRLVSTGDDACPRLWDMSTGKNCMITYQATMTNRTKRRLPINIPRILGNNPILVHPSGDTTIHIFDVHTGKAIRPPLGPVMRPISALAWRPGREQMVLAGSDGDMYLFEPPIPPSPYSTDSPAAPRTTAGPRSRQRRSAAPTTIPDPSLDQDDDDWS
ncbi:WD40-repeat-containing domain protein [Piptocephalis cylindrospora]|uniref:WD40-repeat-containing domain protein n=1 Tax=Piptocephalis cylindrospora TaxID=1907219 RepID=A0A4P9Y3A9_9FUNG|nr:WD40-repeat-containing domain protein [Piptocephalis cylindrospora]|eukprot:RKP13112.1 WD40-repeat-containing domain protein [Piptocephalis cylindrospora]